MQAVIMAGGEGKRLRPLTDSMPKPLLPINGTPLLDYLVRHCARNGADNIIVCTGYLAEKVAEHIDRQDYSTFIRESRETTPLGTAGPLLPIKNELEEEFFVLYGDVYTTADLRKMLEFHRQKKGDATLLLHTSDHPQDSTVVTANNNNRITGFVEKPGSEKHGSLTSAALYVLNRDIVNFIDAGKTVDFAKDVFPKMLAMGKKLYGYTSEEFTRDMGTEERYKEVKEYDAAVGKKQEKGVAAFLDRDGVINEEVNLLTKPQQLKLIKGAAEGIKLLNERGILAIVTTNQPVVARNLVTEEQLLQVHRKLKELLEEKGARLDAIYYCPHHPEKNHSEANNPKYRRECRCRKPNTGMVEEAAKTFKIDTGNSYAVGDQTVDTLLGKNARCMTILVSTGYGGSDGKHGDKADYNCNDLLEACKLIVKITEDKRR